MTIDLITKVVKKLDPQGELNKFLQSLSKNALMETRASIIEHSMEVKHFICVMNYIGNTNHIIEYSGFLSELKSSITTSEYKQMIQSQRKQVLSILIKTDSYLSMLFNEEVIEYLQLSTAILCNLRNSSILTNEERIEKLDLENIFLLLSREICPHPLWINLNNPNAAYDFPDQTCKCALCGDAIVSSDIADFNYGSHIDKSGRQRVYGGPIIGIPEDLVIAYKRAEEERIIPIEFNKLILKNKDIPLHILAEQFIQGKESLNCSNDKQKSNRINK